jgi:hypothetical protein
MFYTHIICLLGVQHYCTWFTISIHLWSSALEQSICTMERPGHDRVVVSEIVGLTYPRGSGNIFLLADYETGLLQDGRKSVLDVISTSHGIHGMESRKWP